MNLPTSAPARRAAQGALVAILMAGAATAALAAPRHKAHAPAAAAARDAKLDAMQAQIDAMRLQMAQMQQAQASAADTRVAALEQQLAEVNRQLADVTAAQTADASDIVTLKTPPVVPSLPNGKLALASADGRFTANMRAIVMFDTGKYFQKDRLPAAVTNRDLNDGSNFRRARFGIDGRLFKDFDYALIYEFGGSGAEDTGHIQEAWVQYNGLQPLRIKLGAFEPNIGLAAAASTSQMPLLERASPAEVARNVAAGDSRSALQVSANGVWGSGDAGLAARWLATGAVTGNVVGSFNSAATAFGAQPADEQTALIGRFAVAPFDSTNWQLHLGVNGQLVTQPNDTGAANANRYPVQLRDRPELRLDGARLVDTGGIDARKASVLGLEAAAQAQNFLVESEVFKYKIDRRNSALSNPDFNGWYVQGVWVLTGESRPYNPVEGRFDAPKMTYNFNPAAGTWGAFELAARYSNLDLNYHRGAPGTLAAADAVRGGQQKVSSIGANWYLNPDMRLMLDVLHVDIDRYNAAGAQVGQKYNAVALRSQFNF